MWEELGIAPTADPRAIRRAYALRLRGIDPDRDLVAFQRLRQAYERALAASGFGQNRPVTAGHPARRKSDPPPRRDTARAEALDANQQMLPAEVMVDEREKAAVIEGFRQALAGGEAVTAFAHLKTASAKGLVSLVEEEELFVDLMSLAMIDRSLSEEEFRAMAQHRNWHLGAKGERGGGRLRAEALRRLEADERLRSLRSGAALRDMVATRIAAESWHEGLLAASRRGFWVRGRNEARMLLSRGMRELLRRHFLGLLRAEPRPMKQLLAQYDLYRLWLEDRIDPKLVALLRDFYAGKGLKLSRDIVMLRLAVVVGALAIILGIGVVAGAVGGVAIGVIELFVAGQPAGGG